MQITISRKTVNKIIKMLERYKLNNELSDINFYGCNHPYCKDPDRYKDVQYCINRLKAVTNTND